MRKWILLVLVISCGIFVQAQNESEEKKGNAIVKVFGNFHTGFGQDRDDRGFALDRSYLGYEYKMNNGLSIKGVVDIGKSSDVSDYQRIVYIKNAMLTWKKGKLTLNGGLISTTQFNLQEKAWGHRYIMKSFQDQYKFGHSADLGISAAYKFCDWFSMDAIVVNGEGYKKIQFKDGLNYGLGMTFAPVKGMKVRLYGGLNEGVDEGQKIKWNGAAFIGYANDYLSVGAEYNYMMNYGFEPGALKHGYSVFATGHVSKHVELLARVDDLFTSGDKGELAWIAGAQFKLGPYVKIAPNFRMSIPKADGESNRYWAFISCYFGI